MSSRKPGKKASAVEAAHTGPVADTPGARKHPWLQRWAERLSSSLGYAVVTGTRR